MQFNLSIKRCLIMCAALFVNAALAQQYDVCRIGSTVNVDADVCDQAGLKGGRFCIAKNPQQAVQKYEDLYNEWLALINASTQGAAPQIQASITGMTGSSTDKEKHIQTDLFEFQKQFQNPVIFGAGQSDVPVWFSQESRAACQKCMPGYKKSKASTETSLVCEPAFYDRCEISEPYKKYESNIYYPDENGDAYCPSLGKGCKVVYVENQPDSRPDVAAFFVKFRAEFNARKKQIRDEIISNCFADASLFRTHIDISSDDIEFYGFTVDGGVRSEYFKSSIEIWISKFGTYIDPAALVCNREIARDPVVMPVSFNLGIRSPVEVACKMCAEGYIKSASSTDDELICEPVSAEEPPEQDCQSSPGFGKPIYPLDGSERFTQNLDLKLGRRSLYLAYNSLRAQPVQFNGAVSQASYMGAGWSVSLPKSAYLAASNLYLETNQGGFVNFYAADGGVWGSNARHLSAKNALDGQILVSNIANNSIAVYSPSGQFLHEVSASGEKLSAQYNSANVSRQGQPLPSSFSDDYGRTIALTYVDSEFSGLLEKITAPDGQETAFQYGIDDSVRKIIWPDGGFIDFRYTAASGNRPSLLASVVDESGSVYASISYDGEGNAIGSRFGSLSTGYSTTYATPPTRAVRTLQTQRAGRQVTRKLVEVTAPTGIRVTQPNGAVVELSGVAQGGNGGPASALLSSMSQPAGSGCAAASSAFTYDASGNKASEDDFNGHRTCYVSTTAANGAANLEKVRVEGLSGGSGGTDCTTVTPAGSALPAGSRKVSSQWHPDWALKTQQAEPNKLTTWIYNGQPDPFNGGTPASCTSPMYGATSVAALPDGKPTVVLCKRVEQATTDATGALGFSATVGHGVSGNTTPDTRTWTYTYNQYGQVLSEDGPRTDVADTTTYTYWPDTSFTGADPHAVGRTMGDLKQVTNALGQVTTYSHYDKAGRLLAMSDANGLSTTYTYSPRGFLTSRSLSASGAATRIATYHYDPRGLLDEVSLPGGIVSTSAGQAGAVTGRRYTFQYDDARRLIGMRSASGESVSYALDNSGNITREEWKNADGSTAQLIRREFDNLNRLWKHIRQINGQDAITELGYDARGNLTSTQRPAVAAYGDTASPTDMRRYNALDQLTRIEDALNGSTKPTTLAPKANDALQALNAPNGAGWTYQRDGFGQVLQEVSDAGTITLTYDTAGNLTQRSDTRGITQTQQFDALNRLTAIQYAGTGADASLNQSWRWDSSPSGAPLACDNGQGRLCQISTVLGTRALSYDAFGNITGQAQRFAALGSNSAQQVVSQWGYDGEDRLSASVGAGNQSVALGRDAEGRASQVLGLLNGQAVVVVSETTYQATGEADRSTFGNQRVFDRDFDMGSGLSSGSLSKPAATSLTPNSNDDGDVPTPAWALLSLGAGLMATLRKRAKALHGPLMLVCLAMFGAAVLQPTSAQAQAAASSTETFTHDARGNVQGITRDGNAATYQYDVLDRLKAETGPVNQSITYDANGNRTGDGRSSYTVKDGSNRLQTRTAATVTYDAAGNVVLELMRLNGRLISRKMFYDAANQLANVRINNVLVASYLYDHLGLRGQKTLANPPAGTPAITLYIHDPNGHLFQEIAGSGPRAGQALVTYAWKDDTPAAVIFHDTANSQRIVYLEVDHLNTPRRGTDSTGKVVWTWTSDAFGSTAPNEDPDGDGIKTTINLRFPGQYFDAESGLHYNWHRYYDPQTGRYTQPDPIGVEGGVNPYAYVGGNPLSYTDPEGLQSAGFGPVPSAPPVRLPPRVESHNREMSPNTQLRREFPFPDPHDLPKPPNNKPWCRVVCDRGNSCPASSPAGMPLGDGCYEVCTPGPFADASGQGGGGNGPSWPRSHAGTRTPSTGDMRGMLETIYGRGR
ncbi:RHS repeat-associated core domain-containing protein [uncultured Aquabacterium sp.]|uniref:RHS repeat domain-containing protein n=1 Tax=Aquabacterium commune TaxID=70586 RepID=UPI0030D35E4B